MTSAAEIAKLEHEWMRAVQRRDLAWLDAFLALEFTLTTGRPGAEVRTREEWLAITRERYRIESFELAEVHIDVYADAAVVRSRYRQVGSMDGADRSQTFLMTDVLVRRDGRWQAVTRHITPLEPVLLDRVLPRWDFREVHALEVDAPPERVFEAVWQVTLEEMPVARLLMRLRGMRASASRPILAEALDGFRVVAEEPLRELVLGSIAQPWKLRGGRVVDDDLATFSKPGYAKMALSFRLSGRVLSTETRVLLTDERSRKAFRRYWLVIRPFSGLIRLVWLRAIAGRAESGKAA